MTDPAPQGSTNLHRRLAGRRFLARAAILFEAVWPALWPPLAVVGLFLCVALLNLPPLLPASLQVALLVLVALATAGLLFNGLRKVRLPDDHAADRRLETRSGMLHRPLSVLTDKPATGDAVGLALWQAHAARAITQIGRMHVGLPQPGLARRDPRALRYGLLLSVLACLGIANTDAPTRLYAAVTPSLPVTPGAPATELQAWITPPAYTRIAPIFLKPEGGSVSVPAGSHLTVNVSGGGSEPTLSLNDRTGSFTALDHSSFQADWDLTRGGHLTVRRDGGTLADWTVTVVADQPPTAAWSDNPGSPPSSQRTRLPWQAADDYGVTSLQAELRLRDRPDAPPLVVTIPMPGGSPKTAHGLSQQDLTAHPWAGLPVIGRLVAHDAAGQAGTSADATFTIAERPFHNPVAQVLIAARKSLSLHPDDRGDALEALDGLMQRPGLFAGDIGAFLNLSAIYYGLVFDHADNAIAEAQDMLWQLALHMEEGQTEQTAQSLEEARQAARDAMDKAQQQPNDATRQELAKKLEELRQAIDRHMQALLQEAQRNNAIMPFDPKALRLSDRDMQRMAQQAEQAAKEGRMADAQQQMAQLERMLDQLRNAHVQKNDGKQAKSKRQRGKNQQSVVQDLIAREGGLLDHAQQRDDPNPSAADPNAERTADARVQQALRRALGELMQQFTDLSGEASPGLGEADQAMRDAVTKLNQGQDQAAGDSQQQAIAALQKGNKEMGQAMARMGQQPGQEGEDGQGDGSEDTLGMMMQDGQGADGQGSGALPGSPDQADPNGRDPLGRYNQGSASDNDDNAVPEHREQQRTQAIQDELRRRGADQERPRQELDYIGRLLKQF
ncbi:DUF4175 domain-containing protein [Acidisphaera sp. S103]|uniref:DUF4175 domain-containing protein n=1 Tax=Acidisphaera sp. S103 TaxID=1747223 RepID=UPI00131AB79C|nr:DUF4175 family protein [Acidisphaera sp. S103]